MKVTIRLFWLLLAAQSCFSCVTAGDAPNWEARIPPGAETDPVALNIAYGVKDIPNRDAVETLKGAYHLQPHRFDKLAPKTATDGLYQADIKEESGHWMPPDMGGIGPFYLVKVGTNYHALTERNFATLFGPVEKKSEVLPYLEVYQALFFNRFAGIVTTDTEEQAGEKKPKPPKLTEVVELKDGFRVTLVTYTIVHIEAYFEKTLHLGRDGIVNVERPGRILKEIGEGILF